MALNSYPQVAFFRAKKFVRRVALSVAAIFFFLLFFRSPQALQLGAWARINFNFHVLRADFRTLRGAFSGGSRPWGENQIIADLAALSHLSHGRLDDFVTAAARRHQIDPNLVKAIIYIESRFDPSAVSERGACGLMQLMPETAAEVGVRDYLNPQENIAGGIIYFKRMLDIFNGDMGLALAAYNAGPNAVRQYSGIPPYPETQLYVRKVLAVYRILKDNTRA